MNSIAEWLKRLAVNAEVATVLGSLPSIVRHSGIWGAADEAVLKKSTTKIPLRAIHQRSLSVRTVEKKAKARYRRKIPKESVLCVCKLIEAGVWKGVAVLRLIAEAQIIVPDRGNNNY